MRDEVCVLNYFGSLRATMVIRVSKDILQESNDM